MAELQRVKRQLVSEVVRENVATLHGLPPQPLRRARTRRLRTGFLPVLGLIVAPSLPSVAVSALSPGRAERPTLPRAVAGADPAPAPTPDPDPGPLPAPQAINPAALSLPVRKIVLDPGHGGNDPGAPTTIGLWEKDIT